MRPEKTAIVRELCEELKRSHYALLLGFAGISTDQMATLRSSLRKGRHRLIVAKNTLLNIAARAAGRDALGRYVEGPAALIVGQGDPVDVAKIVTGFVKSSGTGKICGGLLDGIALSAADVERLASLPPRDVLYAQVVRALAGPLQRLLMALAWTPVSLVNVLKAFSCRQESDSREQS